MDRFPSEFYEIFKQQLVARGINASEISTCEEQIFEGKFTDLIDAIRQNDLIEEPELKSIIQAIEQKNNKPDILSKHSLDESSKFVFTMPKLEQDSENFVPNLQMLKFESVFDESEYLSDNEEEINVTTSVNTNDEQFADNINIDNSISNTFEPVNEIQKNRTPEIEKNIVSTDDLDENSLKAVKDIQIDTDRSKPKLLTKSEKKHKGNKTKRKTDYIAPPPAGSTRRIISRKNQKSDIKNDVKSTTTEITADNNVIEKSPKNKEISRDNINRELISEASTRILKSSLTGNQFEKMLNNPNAKAQELVFNYLNGSGAIDIDRTYLSNLKGYKLADRYELIDLLGFGGNSAVYKARKLNTSSDNIYAIKIICPEPADPAKYLTRFKQEAKMLKRLSQGPNLIHINAYGKDQNLYYLVLDYVEGESLASLISRKAPLSEELTLAIISEILKPLYHAHTNGIIHRDIKPGNILVGKSGSVRLTDFGLAIDLTNIQRKTQHGQILGTPHYMAPEQISSSNVDARTDLYALGVVMFECLTGQKPFNEPTDLMLLSSIVSKQPDKPTRINSKISKFTEKVILQLLKKEPRVRFQSAKELYEVIAKAKLPTPQPIYSLELSIDDMPVMPSKPYSRMKSNQSMDKKGSQLLNDLDDSYIHISASDATYKDNSIHKRQSKRIDSEKLSIELGGEEKIMEILKIIENKQSIPYPGMKPRISTREEYGSDRLKSIAKSNLKKFQHSIRKSQRIISTIKDNNKLKYFLVSSMILLFLVVLFSIISVFSTENSIGRNLPVNTLAYFECDNCDSFQSLFQKSRYFRNESKINEFLSASKIHLISDLVNSFGFNTDNDSKTIVDSITKICCSFCKIDERNEWAIIFELDNSDILRKIKNDPEYKKMGFRISKIDTALPPVLVVLSNDTLGLASSKKYSVMLKGSFLGNTPTIDKPHIKKYLVAIEDYGLKCYIDFEQSDGVFDNLNAYTWVNKILVKGINSISIQALNTNSGSYTEIVPTTEQSFVLGQAEFSPKSEFDTLKYVPINAVSSTSCNFSNIASGASWFNRYYPDSIIKDLIRDKKQFITSLTGEVSVVQLMNFEQRIFIIQIKRENTVSVERALQKVFTQNMPIGDNVNNHENIYWRIDSDVLIITSVGLVNSDIMNYSVSEIEAMHTAGIGAILDCIKPVNSVEQKNITEHLRFNEVRSQLADSVAILHISTIRNFIGVEESVVCNAFSNLWMPYLVGFCFLEKENGDFAIQFSLNPSELLGLMLLKFCVVSENNSFESIEKTSKNQTQPLK